MKISANIWRNRHGTWYFRAIIPQNLQHHFPNHKREIRRSLRTDSRRQAVQLARMYRVEFDQLLNRLDTKGNSSAIAKVTSASGLLDGISPEAFLRDIRSSTISTSNSVKQHESPPLSQIIAEYCAEQVLAGNWKSKTELENRSIYDLLIRIIGDQPINGISHATMRNYKETLKQLPPHMNKAPQYRNKTISEILSMSDVIPMSTANINKSLIRASSLFTWATRQSYIIQNVAQGLAIKIKRRDDQQRDEFSLKELQTLFNGYIYRGPFPKHSRVHPYQFWLPLLGLYTGARIEELCKLRLEDICQIDTIWYLDIKNTKTAAGERLIPIHQHLIDLCFINYVTWLKEQGVERLFPELSKERDGYSQTASKWFRRYRDRYGIGGSDGKKCFHSLRHTVINNLKQRGDLPREHIAAIVGHQSNDVTFSRYGKQYHPAVLIHVVNAIHYEGLDLSHVKFDNFQRNLASNNFST